MMKVLIADDESGVCRLLHYLVDWEALNLEIVRTAHSGWEALQGIEQDAPDIVVTDVCMPGHSGVDIIRHAKKRNPDIRFIMISGYREFEYARDALKYGADDYLLKPLKKAELEAALKRIIDDRQKKVRSACERFALRQYADDMSRKMREEFVTGLLGDNPDVSRLTEQYINGTLHCRFTEAGFLCIVIRADILSGEADRDGQRELLEKKILPLLQEQIANLGYACCSGVYYDMLLMVINADPEEEPKVCAALRIIFQNVRDMTGIQMVDIRISAGKGLLVREPAQLPEAMRCAAIALCERLRGSGEDIIEYRPELRNFDSGDYVTRLFRRRLLNALGGRHAPAALMLLNELQQKLERDSSLSGYAFCEIIRTVLSVIFVGLDDALSPETIRRKEEELRVSFPACSSVGELFDIVRELVQTVFAEREQRMERISSRPIREAEEYMAAHYGEEIDLESVSSAVGLSPSYFSRTFREETGRRFIDYLTEIRMTEAQRLLEETDLPIAQIAEAVGYPDEKYFSRAFKKHSGLKPREHRKLYSV